MAAKPKYETKKTKDSKGNAGETHTYKGGRKVFVKAPKAKPKPAPKPLADRVKTDPKLLARALADPGLRSKLPSTMLSPAQRQQRKDADFDKAFGDIQHPLSGHPLIEAAKKLTDEQYKPQLDELDVADAKAQASGTAQQGWIKDYAKTIGGRGTEGIEAQKAAAAAHVAQQAAMRAKAMDAITGNAADQAARAAGRDPSLDGGAAAAMAAANQGLAARAAAEATANETNAGAADAAQMAFLTSMAGAQQARMGEAATQVGTRTANALAESGAARKTLAENRGNAYTKNLVDLRAQAVEHALTQRGLANDAEKAQIDADVALAKVASQDALARWKQNEISKLKRLGYKSSEAIAEANRLAAATKARLDRESREGIAAGHDATSTANNKRTNAGGGKPRFTSASRQSSANKRDDAIGGLRRQVAAKAFASREEALLYATNKYGDVMGRIAVAVAYDNGAVDHLNQELKDNFGIEIPKKYRRRSGGK